MFKKLEEIIIQVVVCLQSEILQLPYISGAEAISSIITKVEMAKGIHFYL